MVTILAREFYLDICLRFLGLCCPIPFLPDSYGSLPVGSILVLPCTVPLVLGAALVRSWFQSSLARLFLGPPSILASWIYSCALGIHCIPTYDTRDGETVGSHADMCRGQKLGSKIRKIRRQNRMSRSKIHRIPRQNHLVGIQDLQDLTTK